MTRPRLLDLFSGAGGAARGYQLAGLHVTGVDIKPMPRYCGDAFIQGDALAYAAEHGHEYDAIHASPPCQAYCVLKSMPNAKKHPELVAPCREILSAIGVPWVIENVMGAPLINPTMLCGTMFGLGTGDADLRRHRIFETNWPLILQMGMFCKHGLRAGMTADPGELFGDSAPSGTLSISVHDSSWRGHDEGAEHERRRRKTCTVTGSHGDAGLSIARQKRPSSVAVYGNAGGSSVRDGLLYFSTAERNEAMGIDWMKGGEISQAIPPAYTHYIGAQLMKVVQARKAVPS